MANDKYADLAAKYGVSAGSSDNYDDLAAKYGVDQKPAGPAPVAGLATAPETRRADDGFFDRLGRGFSAMGSTVASGAGAFAEGLRHPIEGYTNPSKRREIERGLDNMVTLGYGQRFADWAGKKLGDRPDVQIAATAEADRQAAPGFRELGSIAGAFTPGGASGIAKGSGKAIDYITKGIKAESLPTAATLGALRATGANALASPAIAGLSAEAEGNRLGAAREALSDPAAAVLAGTTGAAGGLASRVAETAPSRLLARTRKDITTGEQNAGIRKTRKVNQAVGEDDAALADLFKHDPQLEKTLAIKASTSPKAAVKAARESIGQVGDRLDDIYDTMAKANRLVAPQDIANGFDKILAQRLKDGDLPAVNILRAERARFLNEYGNVGHLMPDTLRGLKATAGKGAFEGQPIPGNVKRDIWGAYADAIETQAKGTKGIDISELRSLNKDMSVLIPIRDALEERAISAAHGRHSIGSHIGRAALAGAGFAHGGVKEAVIGLAKRYKGIAPDVSAERGARIGTLSYGAGKIERDDRGYATSVLGNLQAGMPLSAAVDAADNLTTLSPSEERRYQTWKATLPERLQYEGDYDLRGFWKKNPTFSVDNPEQHMTDEFKLPNHKTFSNESRYYNEKTKHLGGHWEGDVYIPNDTRYKQRVDESGGS
jgi:hypothetical protein